MSTRTQTRSRSRGRLASGSSKSARPVSRIRTATKFEDPDYSQPTPEPKSAASLSPTWVEVHGTEKGKLEPSTSYVRRSDLPEHTTKYPSGRGNFDIRPINEQPSVPWPMFRRANGQLYTPVSTFCGPPGTALDGSLQDPVARSNYGRAKAMASPASRKRSNTPRKRVVISTNYDSEDDDEDFSPRIFPTWRKTRPDTPTSARFGSFKLSSVSGLLSNIPQPGFIWLLILLAIIKSLTSLAPTEDTLHSAHQTICNRLGNPTGLNCTGNLNFTVENVVSHCHNAADKVTAKLDMTSAKATLEDVWHSCKSVVSDASDKVEDVKMVAGEMKEALCKISGSEGLVDCLKGATKRPRSRASKAFVLVGSVFSNSFTTNTRDRKSSLAPLIPTIKQDSDKTSEGHPTTGRADHVVSLAKSAVSSVSSPVSSAFERKVKGPEIDLGPGKNFEFDKHTGENFDSIMQSIMDSLPTQQVTFQESFNKYPDTKTATKPGFNVSRGVEAIAKVPDVQIRHDLAVSKAEFKFLRYKDPTKVTKTTTTKTKEYSDKILGQLAYLQSDLDGFLDCVLRQSNKAVNELSKEVSYGPWSKSWKSFSLWHMGFTVAPVKNAFTALVDQPKQCRKILTRMDGRVFQLLKTRGRLLAEIEYYLEKTLEPDFGTRRYPWLPRLPEIHLPRPCFWPFKCKKKSRSQAEKDRSHRLLNLREALRRVRNIIEGLVEVKKLVDQGSYELKEAQKSIEQQKQRVFLEPKFGRAFLKKMLVNVKVDRAIVKRIIAERKGLTTEIYERVWAQEAANRTDEKAIWISKEMGL